MEVAFFANRSAPDLLAQKQIERQTLSSFDGALPTQSGVAQDQQICEGCFYHALPLKGEMMKRLTVLVLLLACPCWSQSQEVRKEVRQDVKKRKVRVFDKKFWLVTAAVVGTAILDVESTARCINNHTCGESNPLFGKNPTRAKMYGIKGSIAGFAIWSTWWWKNADANDFDTYGHRSEPGAKQPRYPGEPRSGWYLPATIFIGVSGGAGIYNLASKSGKPQDPVLPAQLSRYPGN
ncbi:MAG: hypothetical protein HY234_03740 [Acidobacteria bacterium]|nr:hypothetical protein [Acidobacteriota bacterium]MBI3662149.1 hypothetical protein [Acidobacteriota bacterium]